MSDVRLDSSAGGPRAEAAGSPEAAEDLRALKHVTARDVPTLDDTVRMLSRRPDSKPTILEEYAMATMDFLKRRPGIAGAAAIALAAFALLVFPFSYER